MTTPTTTAPRPSARTTRRPALPPEPAATATTAGDLRDHFAGIALGAILADTRLPFRKWRWAFPDACEASDRERPDLRELEAEALAALAYKLSDAMLRERARR